MSEARVIYCEWREIEEFFPTTDAKRQTRKGRYHGSVFPRVKHFGSKQWVICGYLEVDYEEYARQGMSEKDIVDGCVAYLNKPPERKKYQKRARKPLYGNLSLYSYKLKKDDSPYIEVILVTDERKNKNFWGCGISI